MCACVRACVCVCLPNRFATGYYGWSKQQPPPPAPEGGGGIPTVSLVVPITCTVVVLALALLYELRKHIEHRKLFGKVGSG